MGSVEQTSAPAPARASLVQDRVAAHEEFFRRLRVFIPADRQAEYDERMADLLAAYKAFHGLH